MPRNAKCTDCALHKSTTNVCVWGEGPTDADVVIIGEAPGEAEARTGKPFQGKSGQLLRDRLAQVGLTSVYITNIAKCRPPQNRTPEREEIAACRKYLDEELETIKPRAILTLGSPAAKAVLKKAKITAVHGQIIEREDGVITCAVFHPAYCLRDPSKLPAFEQDLARFARHLKGQKRSATVDWDIVQRENLDRFIEDLRRCTEFSFDTETTGLDWYAFDSQIRTVQLGLQFEDGSDFGWVIASPQISGSPFHNVRLFEQIMTIVFDELEGKDACAQNGKFDNLWLFRKLQRKFRLTFDTMLASHTLDENADHDLKSLVRANLDEPDYDVDVGVKTGKMVYAGDIKKLFRYGAYDAVYTLRLKMRVFMPQFRKDLTLRNLFFKLVMPAARAFEDIDGNGLHVNLKQMEKTSADVAVRIAATLKDLNQMARAVTRRKINWNAPPQVGRFLYGDLKLECTIRTPKGAPSTNEEALLEIKSKHPIAERLVAYRELEKFRSTYLDGWKEFMAEEMLYLSTKLHGTVCFTTDTLIPTSRGVLTFEKVKVGDLVLTHRGHWKRITRKIRNGKRPTLRVTLENGLQLTTTLNHPYRTKDGWKNAGDLNLAEEVVVYGTPEQWAPIKGWPEYRISSWGRVINCQTLVIRKLRAKDSKGHLIVTLIRGGSVRRERRSDGNQGDFSIARLVALAFIPNPQRLPEVRHLDGNAWNNNQENLAWGTRSDNWADTLAHGSNRKTESPQAKLTWTIVRRIRSSPPWPEGPCHREFSEQYGVCERLIRAIRKGDRWPDRKLDPKNRLAKFSLSRIEHVQPMGNQETFGLEIEEDHSHVTNGIITHNTGRYSSRLHQIPRDGMIRTLVDAPDGWVFVQADLSQAELRVAAILAHDIGLISCYRRGIDVHWRTLLSVIASGAAGSYVPQAFETAKALGLSSKERSLDVALELMAEAGPEKCTEIWKGWKEGRKRAKAVNFGYLFGMRPPKFIETCKMKYGFEPTMKEAEQSRYTFFHLYQQLEPWHKKQIRLAHLNGYVRNLAGRMRRLPGIHSSDRSVSSECERQAINSPVQGYIGDHKAMAVVEIHETFDRDTELRIVGEVHDAILMWVRPAKLNELLLRVAAIMREPRFVRELKINLPVPLEAEFDVGPWGGGKAWKGETK